MEKKDKKILLDLAREAIVAKLENRKPDSDISKISAELKEKRGTFVTLKIGSQLRGCIGHIAPVQELYRDVIENARDAAFSDPRFSPLTEKEFQKIEIEISVLDPVEKLNYDSKEELIESLAKNKPGVILKKNGRTATFLPQVWEDLPDAEEFLCHLCLKAGLDPFEWSRGVEVEVYFVEKIAED